MDLSVTSDPFALESNSPEISQTQLVEKPQLQTAVPASPTPAIDDANNLAPMSTTRMATLVAGLCLSLFLVTLDFVSPIVSWADCVRIY
jgi:hypothetical protein